MSEHSKQKIVLGFAAIYLIWGSTYMAIRLGVETLSPFLMAGLRFVIGGSIFYVWMRARGIEAPRPSHWWTATIIGVLLAAGGTGLVTWAEMTVPSGLTALLVGMVPMWIVMADWFRPGGTRPTLAVVFGLFLGFTGVALLINPTDIGGSAEIDKFGALLIFLATISWAAGSIYSRHAHQPRSKVLGAGMQMMTGGAVLLVASALTGELAALDLGATTLKSWLALGYLITIGSAAFAVYIWLLSSSTPAKVSTYAYVNPVIALVIGNLVAGEILSGRSVGCSAMIVVAVIVIITARTRAGQREEKSIQMEPCRESNGIKA